MNDKHYKSKATKLLEEIRVVQDNAARSSVAIDPEVYKFNMHNLVFLFLRDIAREQKARDIETVKAISVDEQEQYIVDQILSAIEET